MPAFCYTYVVDLDTATRSILKHDTIQAAITFVDRYNIFDRNVVVYATRYDEVLAFKSNVLLTQTYEPRLCAVNKVPYEK